MYGHVNNIIYYSYFDTIINEYEIKYAQLNPSNDLKNKYGVYCVSSSCKYLSPIKYPQIVNAGLSVKKIGYSSVVYHIGIFTKDDNQKMTASAYGDFVHVFVEKKTNKKISVPLTIKNALEKILVDKWDVL